jgi:DNA-binding MltR family transcriptional regulator
MKSNKEVKLRIKNFTKEEKEQYKNIVKLTSLLNELNNDVDFQGFKPNEMLEDWKLLKPDQKNDLIQKAFSLSQKIFYTMQEGLYDN